MAWSAIFLARLAIRLAVAEQIASLAREPSPVLLRRQVRLAVAVVADGPGEGIVIPGIFLRLLWLVGVYSQISLSVPRALSLGRKPSPFFLRTQVRWAVVIVALGPGERSVIHGIFLRLLRLQCQ